MITFERDGAWTHEQVIDFMIESIARVDFYILCPDSDAPRELNNKTMACAVGDLIKNRPTLSRWHSDFQAEYEKFLEV